MDFEIKDGVLIRYTGNDTDVIIPDGVTHIGAGAFENCERLTSIMLPDSVTSIDYMAFCQGKSFGFHYRTTNNMTIIDYNVFHDCRNLKEIKINKNNNTCCDVDGVLFSKDKKILVAYPAGREGSYSIPEGVTNIGDNAFYDCERLTSINIPDSVVSIGIFAFWDCTWLTHINIPDSVKSIGDNAFGLCTHLRRINIPDSVTSIGDSAFNGCRNLKEIKINKNNNTYCDVDGVLFSKDKKTLIVCPAGREGSYSIPKSVTSIGVWAFSECQKLKSIIINGFKITCTSDYSISTAVDILINKDFSQSFGLIVKYKLIVDYYFFTADKDCEAYIKKNFLKIARQFIENNDTERINKILEKTNFVTKRNIEKLLTHATDKGQQAIYDILNDYKKNNLK